MKVIYVSGKYSDSRGHYYVELNVMLAKAISVKLWQMGFAVITPHTNTAFMDGPIEYSMFIKGDLELVRRSDCIVMLPNWRDSSGAMLELQEALKLGKPVFYWEDSDDEHNLKLFAEDSLGFNLTEHVSAQLKHYHNKIN